MTLHERVARALYEQQRGKGWDDAIDLTREVYLELATAALRATAEWLEAVRPSAHLVGKALRGASIIIRKCGGLPQVEYAPEPAHAPDPTESPGKRELREMLESWS